MVNPSPPGLVRYFIRANPRPTLFLAFLLCLFGLVEGLGVATLLPFLESIIGGDEPSDLVLAITAVIERVGLQPRLEVFLGLMLLLFALKGILQFAMTWLMGIFAGKVVMGLRLQLIDALSSAQWTHIGSYPKGFVTNALSAEADRTSMAYGEVVGAAGDAIQAIFYAVVVLLISWQTATLALVAGGTSALLLARLIGAARRAAQEQTSARRELIRRLTDALPSMKSLKAMNREHYLLPLLRSDVHQFFRAQRREAGYFSALISLQEPILVGFLVVGLWAVVTFNLLAISSLLVLAALFYRLVKTTGTLQKRFAAIASGETAFHSLISHIDAAQGSREVWLGTEEAPTRIRDAIRLEGVSFAYGDNAVLESASAEFPAGEFIALEGSSGSGKTTTVDLILGLIRPQSGRVTVDGADLSTLEVGSWRRRIGYVPQEILLFSDSIRNNLTLGDEGVSDKHVWEALEAAGATEFVRALPERLDTRIGEAGMGLSGGQRQRLAIARALVSRPALLVLDEPTTALDARTEADVCASLAGLRGKLMVIAISHQPALTRIATKVLQVSNRRIRSQIEEGCPAEAVP